MKTKFITSISAVALLSACAPMRGPGVFGGSDRMRPESVHVGRVLALRSIQIRRSSLDAMRGAGVGAAAGGGIGAAIAGAKGALVGALAGLGIGAGVGDQQTVAGVLITVQFRNGAQAFPQPLVKHERPFRIGERVEVLEGRRFDRVLPLR